MGAPIGSSLLAAAPLPYSATPIREPEPVAAPTPSKREIGLVDQWILARAKEWAGARDWLFWVLLVAMAAGAVAKAVL